MSQVQGQGEVCGITLDTENLAEVLRRSLQSRGSPSRPAVTFQT